MRRGARRSSTHLKGDTAHGVSRLTSKAARRATFLDPNGVASPSPGLVAAGDLPWAGGRNPFGIEANASENPAPPSGLKQNNEPSRMFFERSRVFFGIEAT